MTKFANSTTCTLIVSCPDAVGIVAAVANFVAERSGSLVEPNHHTDIEQGWFFMSNQINSESLMISLDEFREQFESLAERFGMQWILRDNTQLQKIILLASHASHCLADLLYRWKAGKP